MLSCLVASEALAQVATGNTSKSEADLTVLLPSAPGKTLVATYCSSCHALISTIRGSRTEQQWANVVEDMILEHHAPIRNQDIPVIAEYLGKYAGPDNPLKDFPLDLNAVAMPGLERLPFLPADKAKAILDYRSTKGTISSIDELESLLGHDTLEKLKPYVTIGNGESPAQSAKPAIDTQQPPANPVGTSGAADKHIKTTKLAEGVYAVFPTADAGTSTNSAFIVNKSSVWVFDAPKEHVTAEILKEIQALTKAPVEHVFLAHHHLDHFEGLGVYPDASVVLHINCKENLQALPEGGHALDKNPVITYDHKVVFNEDGREIQVIHPGRFHTNGDTIVYLPKEKIVFAGDLYSWDSVGNLREGYLREWIQALEMLEKMDVEVIIPGHGDHVANKQDVAAYRAYITALVNEVDRLVKAGKSLEEIQKTFDLPEYRHLEKWDRMMPRNLERAYQELAGKWTPD
jgi:cyclase